MSTYDGMRSSRGKNQGRGRRTKTEKGRHLGVGMGVCRLEGWPNPKRENRLLGYVSMAGSLM